MPKRAHSTVVSSGTPETPPEVTPEVVPESVPDVPDGDEKIPVLLPVTARLLPRFNKINTKGYFSLEEFDRICLMVAGDEKRAIQRLLVGLYQRVMSKKDESEVRRIRLLMSMHDSEKLDQYLNLVQS